MAVPDFEPTLRDVILAVESVRSPSIQHIHSESRLLSEVDLDSIQILELTERLKQQFGIDLGESGQSVAVLSTPKTITYAILSRLSSEERTLPVADRPSADELS